MADNEEKTVTDEKAAAGEGVVTDEELASSWDKIVSGETEEAVQAEKKPEDEGHVKEEPDKEVKEKKVVEEEKKEPDDPLERTKFGRILKAQEDRIKQLEAQLSSNGKTIPHVNQEEFE
jgi:hypothetical protein